MEDAEESDLRFSTNAAYGVVGLNILIWVRVFYQLRNIGIAGHVSLALMAVPASAIGFMIVVPILLLRIGKPRIALAVALISLVFFAIAFIDIFLAAGI